MGQKLKGIAGLVVLDLGVGMAAALTAKLLADAGAQVTRIEPEGGDPFDTVYPAYADWRANEQRASLEDLDRLLAGADVCIIGGEDYPGLEWRFDADALACRHPRLVVVSICGYVAGAPARPAVDLLVQARTGLVHEQLPDQPVRFAIPLPSYGAALMAHVGLWVSLLERERTGRGRVVRASMQQGTALFWSQIWMEASKGDANFNKLPPKGVSHLIFRCADGDYLHFVLGVPGALATVYRILGIDEAVDPNERGIPSLDRPPRSYFADADKLAPAILKWKRQDLLEAFWAAGIPAEPVMAPGESWDDEQVAATGVIVRNARGRRCVGFPLQFTPVPGTASRKRSSEPADEASPLRGLKVVDLGNFVAGPFSSKHLADFGADVIKVEPPNGLANLTGLRNTWVSNRGKRSICVDAKSPEGMQIINELCARADVVHHNFRLGVAERMKLDPASLRDKCGDVVTLQTRAYGSHGPKANKPGFDMIMQALCGHEVRAGGEGNPPMWYRSALVDYATGTLGAIGMLMALYERSRTGVSVDVELSLLSSALFLLSELVQDENGSFVGAPVLNAQRTGFHPAEQLYRTRDGWVAIAARTDEMAERLWAALQLDGACGPRSSWGDDHARRLSERIAELDTETLLQRLERHEVWAEKAVPDGWSALRDDPIARREHLVIQAPDSLYGEITSCFGPLVNLSGWSPGAFKSAPKSGEHTREILRELGYTEDRIDDLYRRKIVA